MRRSNPIVNAPGRISYFTNSGVPYTEVVNPSDVRNIDPLAQPKETVFINKNASGTRAGVGAGHGVGFPIDPSDPESRNIMWDNERGKWTGNTGQDIGVVKVTGQIGAYHKSYSPFPQDTPFIQYGATNKSINGRRLVGSRPQMAKRPMSMTAAVVATREYELRDPRNPFSATVKEGSQANVHTQFLPDAVDVMVVAMPNNRKHMRIPMDRGWTAPRYPINTLGTVQGSAPAGQAAGSFASQNIGTRPYINPSIEINTQTYIQNFVIKAEKGSLDMAVTANLANAGAATFSVDWGDGSPVSTGNATGNTVTHTFANTGVYDVRISNSADPNDFKVERYFMTDPAYVPLPLSFDPAFEAAQFTATPGTEFSTTFRVNGAPFIKIAVNWGEDRVGSLQNLIGYMPDSGNVPVDITGADFTIRHTYKYRGTYMVKIYAEHLVDDGPNIQQRRQITVVKHIQVS